MTAAQFHCMTIFWSSAAVLAICNCEISDGAYIHMHVRSQGDPKMAQFSNALLRRQISTDF